jgi:Tfp pilus assembly protein PilF
MPANSVADQVALGEAWYTVARRFDDTDALDKAKSIVEPLTDIANAPTDAWLLLGGIQQMQNDLPAAEHSFAAAVNLAPNLPVAKNNLAMIMLLRNEDAKTAQQLATAAVTEAPANSAIHSTLGEIDQKLNDLDGAKSQFQLAVRLNAQNAEALIGLATVQHKSGDARSAAVTLQQVETVLRMTHPILPAQVRDDLDKLRVGEKPTTTSATGA